MSWLQVSITSSEDQVDYIEGLMQDLNALSITMQDGADDPILEPDLGTTPMWDNTVVVALFGSDTSREMIISHLEQHNISQGSIRTELIEDRDWEREWMTHFQPMKFGERLWICPSWHTPEQKDAVNLMLDPGLAFGTGTHPTTSLCLTWLDSQNLDGKSIIDYGCGSGVLAIAGLLLGAQKAVGTDIDPQALEASQDNALRNGVAENLEVYLPDKTPADIQSNIVIANILANPLVSLAPTLAALCLPKGNIALSGILKDQEELVVRAYEPYFELYPSQTKEDWILISGERRG